MVAWRFSREMGASSLDMGSMSGNLEEIQDGGLQTYGLTSSFQLEED